MHSTIVLDVYSITVINASTQHIFVDICAKRHFVRIGVTPDYNTRERAHVVPEKNATIVVVDT